MKISARNQFGGRVAEIKPGAVEGTVKVDIGHGMIVTAKIAGRWTSTWNRTERRRLCWSSLGTTA